MHTKTQTERAAGRWRQGGRGGKGRWGGRERDWQSRSAYGADEVKHSGHLCCRVDASSLVDQQLHHLELARFGRNDAGRPPVLRRPGSIRLVLLRAGTFISIGRSAPIQRSDPQSHKTGACSRKFAGREACRLCGRAAWRQRQGY